MSDYSGRKILIGVVIGTLLSIFVSSVLVANDKTSHLTESQGNQEITILLEECAEIPKTFHPPLKFIKECDYVIDTDKDNIDDNEDKCLGSAPEGVEVDEWGCALSTSANDGQKVVKLPPIPTDVLFAFDSATLTVEGQKILGSFLVQVGGVNRVEHIQIVGHTDQTGTQEYNQALSEKRAKSAADYWIGQGVPPEKITQRGEGELSPIANNETPESRAKNRRVEITVTRL